MIRSATPYLVIVGACLLGPGWSCLAKDAQVEGLVVERVTPELAGARADLRAGDLLLEWRRRPAPSANAAQAFGKLRSPFDLRRVEIEEAPRGPIELIAIRDNARLALPMRGSKWGIEARPSMDGGAFERYRAGRRSLEAGDTSAAVAAWMEVAERLQRAGDPIRAAWMWWQLSEIDPLSEEARRRFARALALAEALGPPVAASLWAMRAERLERTAHPASAEQAWREAIDLRESVEPDNLALAHDLYMLGTLKGRSGDLEWSEELVSRSLQIRRELAPGSLQEAESLTALGIMPALRGDLDAAAEHFEQALSIALQNDPAASEAAAALNALGNVAQRRGRLADAEGYYQRALEINQQIERAGLNASFQLNNLGFIAELRGDLARAEDFYRRALAIKREKAPGTIHVPRAIDNLAFIAFARGDLARAEDLHRQALPLYEELAAGSLVVSTSLKLLANVNLESGDLDSAAAYFDRARELEHDMAPLTLSYAEILHGLGRTAEKRGDVAEAQALYVEALDVRSQVAPGSLEVAESLERLGGVALAQQDFETAEDRYRAAVTIRSRLAPGTAGEAEARHALGSIFRATDREFEALEYYTAALDALEAQRGKLGGTDVIRTRFAARYGHLYKDSIELLLDLGRYAAAFDVLERYRARGLLAMLAERDLLLDQDLPDDIVERRSAINGEYDQITTRLQQLDNSQAHAAEVGALLARLRALQADREQLARTLRVISPRLAAAESPQPLSLDEVYRELDQGTALLSYAVAESGTWLFALRKDRAAEGPELRVLSIDLGERALSEEVAAMRLLIQTPGAGEAPRRALLERGHRLYQHLLEPAQELIAASERLLIIPDGPLHLLAFAALPANRSTDGSEPSPRYLIEDHPVHTAVSATVYAELRRRSERPHAPNTGVTLVAFADPAGPGSNDLEASDGAVAALLRGRELGALPHARQEVESIADLYRDSARLYFGNDASERRAKQVGREPTLIHFASHAVLDTNFPLDSYLALSPSEGFERPPDNGLLQAWEIFEQMRIDADLVTLSACDTGSGAEGGGEGLIGLTRAFQYAGARAILASLWPVSDRSTSLLMSHFYANLERRMPKDEALRAAQLELIRRGNEPGAWATVRAWLGSQRPGSSPDLSHPFHWAAFQLIGDAR